MTKTQKAPNEKYLIDNLINHIINIRINDVGHYKAAWLLN